MGKRKKRGARPRGLTPDQQHHLLNGWCLSGNEGRDPNFPFRDEKERKELWFQHRPELMANCNISYRKREGFHDLGRQTLRPDGFWEYEAKVKPIYGRNGTYISEMKLLEKMNQVTHRDRELFREIEEAEAEYSGNKSRQGGKQNEKNIVLGKTRYSRVSGSKG